MNFNTLLIKRIRTYSQRYLEIADLSSSMRRDSNITGKTEIYSYLSDYKQLISLKELCGLYIELNPNDEELRESIRGLDKQIMIFEKMIVDSLTR